MKKILFKFFSGLWYFFSLLPLSFLYALSDVAFYLIYYVIRYRRGVVRKNLSASFPEKTKSEIIIIEKEFYSWFCDYIGETIKMASMSEEEMSRRMKFEGMEEIEDAVKRGQSSFLYLGHYCNWEWITSIPLHSPKEILFAQIYHVLNNGIMDKLFLENRERFGAVSVAKENTLRQIVKWDRAKKITITGFISDQVPKWNSIHYWTDFMNQDTPVFTGTERIARKFGYAVFYGDVRRVKRGYYVCKIEKMCDDARETKEFELTEKYMRLLEQTIRRDPQYWLWSHNRWKRTHEKFNELYAHADKRETIMK